MKMAPHATPTEIIEILSDDDSPARAIPAHSSSQSRPAGVRKPAVPDSLKRHSLQPNKKKTNGGFVERNGASASPSSKHPTALRSSVDNSSRPPRAQELPPTPVMPTDWARESTTKSSATKGAAHGPNKSLNKTIVLSDDESPIKPPAKKPSFRPRGFDSDTERNDTEKTRVTQRPAEGKSDSPKKRPRENESPSNPSAPAKKMKLSQTNGDGKAASKSGSLSRDTETTSPAAINKVQKHLVTNESMQKSTKRNAMVGSRSSSPRRVHDFSSTLSDDEVSASQAPVRGRDSASLAVQINPASLAVKSKPNAGLRRVSSSPKKRSQDHEDRPEDSSGPPKRSTTHNKTSAFSNGHSASRSEGTAETTRSSPGIDRTKSKNGLRTSEDARTPSLRPDLHSDTPPSLVRTTLAISTKALRHETGMNGVRKSKQKSPHLQSLSGLRKDAASISSRREDGSARVSTTINPDSTDEEEHVSSSSGNERTSSQTRKPDNHAGSRNLKSAEILRIKREEEPQRYEELERRRAERVSVIESQSGPHDDLQQQSNGVKGRASPGSPKAAIISRESHTSTSGRIVTESDEADLQLQSEARSAAEDVAMPDYSSAFAHPTVTASELKARTTIYSGMSLATRVEKILGRYMEELRGDNEYWTSVSLRRARLFNEDVPKSSTMTANGAEEAPTSFANFTPLRFSPHKKGSSSAKSDEIWGIQRITPDGKAQPQIEVSAFYTTFGTDQQDVPDFAHYVSIQNNLLAPNTIHLHCWPYFGDDFDMREAQNLSSQYNIDIVAREKKITVLLQAQMYEHYVESALQDLECTWADVLRFLLEGNPDVGSDLDARKAYQNRALYCQDNFSRNSDRWTAVLSRLPPSTPSKLGLVAVLCENFLKMAKFSLWHIARKSSFADLPEAAEQIMEAQPSDNGLTCRICLRFNCPYHGQFKHRPDDSGGESDTESISSVDTAVGTDIIHPLKVNYRSRVTFVPDTTAELDPQALPDASLRRKQRDQNYWNGYRHKADERGPFYPCHHPGLSCTDAKCSCHAKSIPCEKTCSCAPDCTRKFKGCSCGVRKGHQMVCSENPECVCWQNGRECDPDLCGSCGVCDVVDPVNKYNDQVLIGRCRNASIQRGVPKHTLLGDSGVHGLGLYACEDIKHHHFVGEYKGEIITKKEADRRGAVYEHQKLSYLFSLNKHQEIDSTYFGNKVRFINHAHGEKANLYPRIIMVNTVHRIALYASKDIPAGKELLFDYGPLFPDEQLQGKKSKKSAPESKKSAPHVRNANLVKEFYDVSESEDEDGILRAKAVSRGRARTKKKSTEKPRPAVARKPQISKPNNLPETSTKTVEQREQAEQDAGERLAAFNISEDTPSEAVEALAEEEEEEDAAFEPGDSESGDSESSEEADTSDSDAGDDEDDEDQGPVQRGRGRPRGVSTRRRGHR